MRSVHYAFLSLVLASVPLHAQNTKRGVEMQYGPVLMSSVLFPPRPGEPPTPNGPPYASDAERARLAALKGLVVRLGEISACYDLDSMQLVAAWHGFLDLKKTNIGNYKGYASGAAEISGRLIEPLPAAPLERGSGEIRFLGFYRTSRGISLRFKRAGQVLLETLSVNDQGNLARDVQPSPEPPTDLVSAQWPAITLKGTLGSQDDQSYVVDTIPLPIENPWKSWIRPSSLDFFPDGRGAISTLNGDVWIVSGLDDKLEQVTWKRFAVGLFEPLGLKIVDGKILVRGRDQITRLHDLNGDGEADYYERYNADNQLWLSYHAFVFDLQSDSHGSLYYVDGGNALGRDRPWYARLFRIAPDGSHSEEVASGFRAPNGLTIGPDDTPYVSDNQGQWIPSSKISRIKPGGFYGHVADPRLDAQAPAPESFDPPICWLPMTWDNSSSGGVFAPASGWGRLSGKLLHTSFGMASMLAILDAGPQAAAIKLNWKFDSGVMRARFAPHDHQLYVCGLKGWQSRAIKDGCLHRVRYVGKPWRDPIAWKVTEKGIAVTFAQALDRAAAEDMQNYGGEQWNYVWSSTYGSPDIKPRDPKIKGRDVVNITGAHLSEDGCTLMLDIPELQPVMQMVLKLSGKFADQTDLQTEIAVTINEMPKS